MIQLKNVYKKFGDNAVLKGVNLDIYQGEITTIIGKSGAGKSVLLKHIIGLIEPDSGTILYQGKPLAEMKRKEKKEIKRKFSYVFQGTALFDSMTVFENIAVPLAERTSLKPEVIKERVKARMMQLDLGDIDNEYPSQLSGGMKKRVGLARAISMDPQIVFYDEPTAGLDPIVASVIDKLIIDFSSKLNITSVVVTHDMKSVFSIASRVATLYEGKMLEVATPEKMKNSKNEIVQQFINGSYDGPVKFFQQKDDYLEQLTK